MFNLDKATEDVKFVLTKKLGVTEIPRDINVSLLLDYSYSMRALYESKAIETLIQRVLGVANTIDDDGILELNLFHDTYVPYGEISPAYFNNISTTLNNIQNNNTYGGTVYSEGLKGIINTLKDKFPKALDKPVEEPKGFMAKLLSIFSTDNSKASVGIEGKQLILFVTDGENYSVDNEAFHKVLSQVEELSNVYVQFVSLGYSGLTQQALSNNNSFIGHSIIDDLKQSDESLVQALITKDIINFFK